MYSPIIEMKRIILFSIKINSHYEIEHIIQLYYIPTPKKKKQYKNFTITGMSDQRQQALQNYRNPEAGGFLAGKLSWNLAEEVLECVDGNKSVKVKSWRLAETGGSWSAFIGLKLQTEG